MARIPGRIGHGEGGGNLSQLGPIIEELRDVIVALLQKLDADSGVTDTDYESELTPPDWDVE